MLLGYNTNGFAHHRLSDAIDLLADIGYRAIAITLDNNCLDPFATNIEQECEAVRRQLEECNLIAVIESGARFLLDPRRKHWPTLLSTDPEDRARRVDFLQRCIQVADLLGSNVVSLWSGTAGDDAPREQLCGRLVDELLPLIDEAKEHAIHLAFEPEPGMLVATLDDFRAVDQRLSDRGYEDALSLTLDIGHLHCQGETPIAAHIRTWASRIANVHIEDMPEGHHDHRLFGEGSIAFPPIMDALAELDENTPVCVELSRHSHMAPEAARRSFEFLTNLT